MDSSLIKKIRFGLYGYPMISTKEKIMQNIWFIVVKDRDTDVILDISPYTKVLRISSKSIDTREPSTIEADGRFLCLFLNYVFIDNYDRFGIDDLKDITIEHGNFFLKAYSDGKIGGEKKRILTLKRNVQRLAKLYSKIKDIYKKEAKHIYKYKWKEFTDKGGIRYISHFNIDREKDNEEDLIFRDMPQDIFNVFITLSQIYYPELTFAIALQAYAGLRPGEVCNVRQAMDPRGGGGVFYQMHGNKLRYFRINLNAKYPMRADLKDVGSIKKERLQDVYTPYLNQVSELYKKHMQILSQYEFEDGYYPMFVNKDGVAITVKSYREKLQRLANIYLKDELLKSDNANFKFYGKLLLTHTLSPHFLRHFFTVRLVLDNLAPHKIADFRGDKSLSTALIYCRYKEELRNALLGVNGQIIMNARNINYGVG